VVATAATVMSLSPQAPKGGPIPMEGAATMGRATARVGLVVFSNFDCADCARLAADTFPALTRYVKADQLLVAFRHRLLKMTLPTLPAPPAQSAAVAAWCAGEQAQFWAAHNALFRQAQEVRDGQITGILRDLPIDRLRYEGCLASERGLVAVENDALLAKRIGVIALPTVFVGRLISDGVVVTDTFTGAIATAQVVAAVERLLQ